MTYLENPLSRGRREPGNGAVAATNSLGTITSVMVFCSAPTSA